jgi:hypothetical protein
VTLDLDAAGLVLLVLSTIAAALLVPDLSAGLLGQPAFAGVVGGGVALALIVVLRRGRRGSGAERLVLAIFLALMPSIYVASCLRFGGGTGWLSLEVGGQFLFAALAFAGWRWTPRLLVAGIAGHGLIWDLSHYGRTSFMPDWYAIACMVVDLGWAFYAATQAKALHSP